MKPQFPARSVAGLVLVLAAVALPAAEHAGATTIPPNLLVNGDFDNHVWYERFRGWSPSGWCQWFTRGGHAPEHAVGKDRPHSGKEYVRIHMWGHAWRGGILQTVKGVEPCHFYRLTAHGFFQPPNASEPNVRAGIDPCGALSEQFDVDVTSHPAPPYDEGVGDDPETEANEGPDIPETTVWSETKAVYAWERFEVAAEARSETITAILYCDPKQRPAEEPIYEMNWDTVALREVPWATARLVDRDSVLDPDGRFKDLRVRYHPRHATAQVTWATEIPTGASQVLCRFVNEQSASDRNNNTGNPGGAVRSSDFTLESPVVYEHGARRHWVELPNVHPPTGAAGLEVVALSRALIDGACVTICSPVDAVPLGEPMNTTP